MTEDRQYIQLLDDWYVGADSMNFILTRKRMVKPGKAKAENVGKEVYIVVGYYSTLSGMMHGLYKQMTLDALAEPGLTCLNDYLDRLDDMMERIQKLETAYIKRLRERAGVREDE